MRTLKLVLVLVALLALTSLAQGQTVQVRYAWTQPDSTMAVERAVGDTTIVVPATALQDGDLKEYNVFMATPTDTIQVAVVGAPPTLAELPTVVVPVPLGVPVAVAVQAVDQRDQQGPLSEWSEPFAVYPGPPQAAGQPRATAVYLGL